MSFDPKKPLTPEILQALPPLCVDGAWGTELDNMGAEPGEMCDPWNLEQPEKIVQLARTYVEAGAQVILTNTFNSNRIALARHGMAEKSAEITRAGAALSKKAAAGRAYVFGSIGPSTKVVMMGEIDPAEVEEAAAEQAAALAEGGADAVILETQTDTMEAEALLRGAKRGCTLPVGVSFTFDSGPNRDRTMMGASVADALAVAVAGGAAFVGANCGAGIESFPAIARAYGEAGCTLPLWVKGNAGLPELDADGKTVFRAGPEVYRATVPELLAAGAKFIGGCCGSGPAHIRAIREALDAR